MQPYAASELTPNCRQSAFVARPGSKCHRSSRVRCPRRAISGLTLSGTKHSAGLIRANSSASFDSAAGPEISWVVNSPVLTSTQARPIAFAVREYRSEVTIFPRGKQAGLSDGPRSEDPRYRPLDKPVAGLTYLLGDRNGVARAEQTAKVVVQRMVRNAGHRHAAVAAERAGSKRNSCVASNNCGIVVERFVEIAKPVEQDRVGMLCLELQVLTARRNQRRRVVAGPRQWRPLGRRFQVARGSGHATIIRIQQAGFPCHNRNVSVFQMPVKKVC